MPTTTLPYASNAQMWEKYLVHGSKTIANPAITNGDMAASIKDMG
jgi:hypothetical protein